MISVVIPTLDCAAGLSATLASLVPAAVDATVREVVVVDAGSRDTTLVVADDAGARVVRRQGDTDARVAVGCVLAKGPWLLILRPGIRLPADWAEAALSHIRDHSGAAGWFDPRGGSGFGRLAAGALGAPADAPILASRVLLESVRGAGPLSRRLGRGRMRPVFLRQA